MTHKHSVYDTDTHFIIDPKTRTFSNESSLKTLVVKNDINSERFTFELPRLIDGHDMSLCNKVEIHYINIENGTKQSSKDVYDADDLQVSPEDENIVIFSWLLRGNATKYNGTLSFSICFKCLEADEITYGWNTLIYSKLSVGESYSNTEAVVQEYSDVLQKWKLELIEAGTLTDEDISGAVNDYMSRNPISLSSLQQDEEHRLVSDTEKQAWNSKSDFSGNYEDLTNKPTIPSEYTLPIATPTTLGGVKPIAKTDEMTQEVGIDELGGLFTREGVGIDEETLNQINKNTEDISKLSDSIGDLKTSGISAELKTALVNYYTHVMPNFDVPNGLSLINAILTALGAETRGESGGEEPDEPTLTTYTITNTLTNVSSDNTTSSVEENASYTANLTPSEGYTLDSVVVTMGGADITSEVCRDGVITISNVTGNIVITATANEETTSNNPFDNTTWIQGTRILATGVEYTNQNNYSSSDYVDVTNFSSVTINANYSTNTPYVICCFDSEKTLVGTGASGNVNADGTTNPSSYTYEIPSGAVYCRICITGITVLVDGATSQKVFPPQSVTVTVA